MEPRRVSEFVAGISEGQGRAARPPVGLDLDVGGGSWHARPTLADAPRPGGGLSALRAFDPDGSGRYDDPCQRMVMTIDSSSACPEWPMPGPHMA
jgi:hypothetical protein